ncbi:unnamed protein product, partial [Mesorhabditis spiculigera]
MLLTLITGFLLGVIAVICAVIYVIYFDPFGTNSSNPAQFVDQFPPIQIAEEIRKFLRSGEDGGGISKWESTVSLSLLMHLLFQENKDTRVLRRWVHKRLQLELNDLTTRSKAGRFIESIRIRDLNLGTKLPTVHRVRVESAEMSEDRQTFENVVFLIDLEYGGGFETAIDVRTPIVYGGLSLKVTHLAGKLRLIMSRKPYNHWAFSFVSDPVCKIKIDPQIQGHPIKHMVGIVEQQIRKALQRKHVWPNYKVRYRPFFPNPLLQPSPAAEEYAHMKLVGGLEVTVLQGTRIRTALVDQNTAYDVYCTLTIDFRPFLQSTDVSAAHSTSLMLTFSRFDSEGESGLTYEKAVRGQQNLVKVLAVEEGSLAEKANFRKGDIITAINNLPTRSERQVESILKMTGELKVLVERNLDDLEDPDLKDDEDDDILSDGAAENEASHGAGLLQKEHITSEIQTEEQGTVRMRARSTSTNSDSTRRHSLSILPPSTPSFPLHTPSESVSSSVIDINQTFPFTRPPGSATVARTESARVPHVLISTPSMDLRRTRSESQLDVRLPSTSVSIENLIAINPNMSQDPFDISEEACSIEKVTPLGRVPLEQPPTVEPLEIPRAFPDREEDLNYTSASLNIPTHNSQSSLLSNFSNNSSANAEISADEDAKLSRNRPHSTRRARLHATLVAGKKKVLDFMPQKKRPTSLISDTNDSVEMGQEAGESLFAESEQRSRTSSPFPKCPTEFTVKDQEVELPKEEKTKHHRLGRKKKGASPLSPRKSGAGQTSETNNGDSPTSNSAVFAHSRSTRQVHLQPNVQWAQSLHFELDNEGSHRKCYLNMTVHARERNNSSSGTSDPAKPILLGYNSLYLPQILDDCRCTLSNCHRQVFHLRPPPGLNLASLINTSGELSNHPGYDPRLLFGDVTLNFRYFPDGLPEEARSGLLDTSDEDPAKPATASTPASFHDWKPWSAKQSAICALCNGKIWLKNGQRCARCLIVCHNKCQLRANISINCSQNAVLKNDENFEEITSEVCAMPSAVEQPVAGGEGLPQSPSRSDSVPHSMIPPMTPDKAPYRNETEAVSRRTRLKARVSEKIGQFSWRKKKDRPDDGSAGTSQSTYATDLPSPVASIATLLSDVLPQLDGSPFISSVYFQPGNAYNEDTIANAKRLGKSIFSDVSPLEERQRKVNEQIDLIQKAIHETKSGRLEALNRERSESEGERGSNTSRDFEGLDERLQALAVLMLHYCAALQDCCEKEDARREPNPSPSDASSDCTINDSNEQSS